MNFIDVLFLLIWVVVGFFLVRYAAQRFLRERYGAEIAAGAVVAAFILGVLLPFPGRGTSTQSAPGQTASNSSTSPATPPPVCHTPGPARLTVVGLKSVRGGDYRGNIDSLRPETESDRPVADFKIGCNIYANGWAADMTVKRPVPGIGMFIDSKKIINATPAYGQARPDVASGLNAPNTVHSGFLHAEIPTVGMRPGTHSVQVVAFSKDRKSYHLVGQPRTFDLRK